MWLARIALIVALVLPASAATAAETPYDRVIDKLAEALRLESLAFEALEADPKDPEITTLLQRSMVLLDEAAALPAPIPDSVRGEIRKARAADKGMVEQLLPNVDRYLAWVPRFTLAIAIFAKRDALSDLSDAAWRADQKKQAEATRVAPPKCRNLAALGLPGCTASPSWDIFISKDAKRAKCTFAGPRGTIDAARPLFPGTAQERTCRLAGYRTVAGVRKRVVRAELRITVPPEGTPGPPKMVRVTAHWR